MLTFKQVKENKFIQNFIREASEHLKLVGFTDHGFRHVGIVADRARMIAKSIGLSQREQELSAMAGYCHDMGNCLGRTYHHYWGAMLFSQVFLQAADNPEDITDVMQAIVNHDKDDLKFMNKISAVVVLADKSDVHRSRVLVKKIQKIKTDIHDRVNYATVDSRLVIEKNQKIIGLKLKIDTKFVPLMEYFEIFTDRMVYCRKAAEYLHYKFGLEINRVKLL
jgi:metal-dependent HD superfamily phosphatase/phosphodiesterase